MDEEGLMLIFGGEGGKQNYWEKNKVYHLDLTKMKWYNWTSNANYERIGHSANLIANSVYLFGGYHYGYFNDIWKYNIKRSISEGT